MTYDEFFNAFRVSDCNSCSVFAGIKHDSKHGKESFSAKCKLRGKIAVQDLPKNMSCRVQE